MVPLPHRLADHRERLHVAGCLIDGQPVHGIAHRGDGPVQRARLGLRIADVLPVPRDPAAGRAQPGTLTTRREQGPALRTNPGIGHRSHATHPTLAGQRAVTPRKLPKAGPRPPA